MARYFSVAEARRTDGLRLVVTAHVPGLWSEAAKGLFDVKGVDYVLVEQVVGGENRELLEWTAQTSGPVAVWNDERPRSSWLEQLYLAERLSADPPLIPADLEERILMFGLCNELCSENGFGWNVRMMVSHATLSNADTPPPVREMMGKIAGKYGYDPALIDRARSQMEGVLKRLRQQIASQKEHGRQYLIGERLSALDIYWAAFAGAIDPLPPSLCPGMPDDMRRAYSNAPMREIAGDLLLAHRDFIYERHLKLPMDF